jgi:hypothetical protein
VTCCWGNTDNLGEWQSSGPTDEPVADDEMPVEHFRHPEECVLLRLHYDEFTVRQHISHAPIVAASSRMISTRCPATLTRVR